MTNPCAFYDNGICKFASNKAGIKVRTYEESCKACLSGKPVIQGLIQLEKFNQRTIPKYNMQKPTMCCEDISLPTEEGFEGLIVGVVCMPSNYTSMCECYYQFKDGQWRRFHNECQSRV